MAQCLCKLDPTCSTTIPLASTWCVENSINILNYNFSALDVATCNLLTSAKNIFNPITTFIQTNSARFENVYTFLSETSAKIEGAATTVNMLSGFWLTPISIIYKDIFDSNCVQNDVLTWVRANFPAKTGNCINYINGQKLYVFSLKYANLERKFTQSIVATPEHQECYTYQVRVIRRIETRTECKTVASTFRDVEYTCFDKYINDVCGYEYCLVNGDWEFIQAINGY